MATSTNTLQATITATDANGNTSINRGLGNPSLAGVVGDLTINQLLANGANVMALPSANIFNIYVKNLAAPGGGTITPVLTPSGGAAQTLAPIQPGGVLIIWNVINSVAGAGYTSIGLTASVANVPVEYFFGA